MNKKHSLLFFGTQKGWMLLPLLLAFSISVIFFSCESMGKIAQIGAAIGQGLGFIDAKTAEAISKTGVAWSDAFADITPEQEYYIGRAVGANVLTKYTILKTRPEMVTYVNRIANALVVNSPRPEIYNGYHANILDSDEINAFATPGGHIFITRGLIECATSEDTLAAVIAHELSHIQLQHGLKAIKNSRMTNALLVTGTSALSTSGNDALSELVGTLSDSVGEVVTTMVTNGYSQSQEFDADSTAMALMSLAGYEPSSLLDMLRVLEVNQQGKTTGFSSTHPSPTQRIANAQKTVGNYSVSDTRSHREARYKAVK